MSKSASKTKREEQARQKKILTEQIRDAAVCMRCPASESAFACPAAKSLDMSSCTSQSAAGAALWPGFQSDAHSLENCTLDFSQREVCIDLLEKAKNTDIDNFTTAKRDVKKAKDIDEELAKAFNEKLQPSRQAATYSSNDSNGVEASTPLTKEILEAAYTTCHPITVEDVDQGLADLLIKEAAEKEQKNQADEEVIKPKAPIQNKGTLKFPKKPKRSDAPRNKLITNHFIIALAGEQTLYEYQINGLVPRPGQPKLSSPKKNTIIRRLIENSPLLLQHQTSFAFNNEGKIIAWVSLNPNVQLRGMVVDGPHNVNDFDTTGPTGHHYNLRVEFQRTFKFKELDDHVKGLDSDYEEIRSGQALDIMFGNNIARNLHAETVQIGDNRFFPLGNEAKELQLSPKFGLIALRGFSSRVMLVDGSVTLNINTAFSAFYKKQTVQKYFQDHGSDTPKLCKHLLHVRVRILYDRCKPGETDLSKDTEARRTKTITGFSKFNATETYFTDRNNKKVSVWEHFEKEYPNAKSKSKDSICVNTSDTATGRECWFLLDQLEILPGQLYRSTLDTEATATMISFACQSPEANRTSIMDSGLKALGLNNGTPPLLANAGITFKPDMMTIPFRQIDVPHIMYKNNTVTPKEGAWTTTNQQFLSTTRHIDGPVVFFSPPTTANPGFEDEWIASFRRWYAENGISSKLNGTAAVSGQFRRIQTFTPESLATAIKETGLPILVLPRDDQSQRPRYAAFRVAADQIVGKPSLVLCEKRMMDIIKGKQELIGKLVPYMAQNMMKVNTRLGNQNHCVDILTSSKSLSGTLILGADLVHPKQGNPSDVPSIASLVGSIDNQFATFYGSSRRTTGRVEIIDKPSLLSMAVDRIRAWKGANSVLPDKILYYRDGTGQSQYNDIRTDEVETIREAFNRVQQETLDRDIMAKKITVKITAVVVVKRHTTRFYPKDPNDPALAVKQNCVPGTVVDSHITSPYYFDFFLQSHTIEKGYDPKTQQDTFGSAKPTHYFVVVDENGWSLEGLQNITNGFCYNFSHSTSAVSYASPAYLADRLCDRVALYLKRWYDHGTDVADMESGERQREMDKDWTRGKQDKDKDPWNASFNSRMFWM